MSGRREGPRGTFLLAVLLAWLIAYFGVRFFLEAHPALADGTRVLLALLPTPLFALFLWQVIRALRASDEMERRIQLEALAVAFPLGFLLLTTLGLVQRAVELNFENWSYNHIWPWFVMFYLAGLALARRRYS